MAGFQIQCTTTSPGESVTMPFVTGYTFDCYIDWDDATPPSHVTAWDDPNATHTYAMAGSYTITITGACPAWSVNNTHSSRLKWTGIVYWGDAVDFDGWEYLYGGWYGCSNLSSLGSGSIIAKAGLTDLRNLFRGCGSLDDVISADLFADCANVTTLFYAFFASGVTECESQALAPLTSCTSYYRCFQYAPFSPRSDMFCDAADEGTRFLNQSVDFRYAFYPSGTQAVGTIPTLWQYGYGTGTPLHDNWIFGHDASTLTNYNFIPVSWDGTDFRPSTKLLTGSYAYEGLDVGQLRDFTSKLLPGVYAYNGLDVGQLRDFFSKLLPGVYAYNGLDVGQLRDFTSRLLTGAYAYEGLDANIIPPTRGLGTGVYAYSGLALGVLSPYHPMTAILAWIQGIVGSGIPVIFAGQNAAAPTGIYLSVRFVTQTSTPDKIANSRRSGSVIRYHMESSDILGVDVKAFSAAGSSLLRQIELGARDSHSKGVPALIDCGPIYGPTFFNDTHYRPMYHCEFRFRVSAVLDTVGSRVQTLGLGGSVDDLELSAEETFG